MRDTLNKTLETLIWICLGFWILANIGAGIVIMDLGLLTNSSMTIFAALVSIVFGSLVGIVLAGLAFQVMDIRNFTKHAAMSLHRKR